MSDLIELQPPTFDVVDARAAIEAYGLVDLLRRCRSTIDQLRRVEVCLLVQYSGLRNWRKRREIRAGMREAREEMRRRMALLVTVAKACAEELA